MHRLIITVNSLVQSCQTELSDIPCIVISFVAKEIGMDDRLIVFYYTM